MTFGFPLISASTNRLIVLAASSLLLLAAGDVSQAVNKPADTNISDSILAPVSAAEAAAAAAALAATTPPDVAAAYAADQAANQAEVSTAEVSIDRPASLSHLVASIGDADTASDSDIHCLATAVYFEARGEPMEGQLAVAQTILNRVQSGHYAPTVCGVINQPKQFSYDRTRAPSAGNDWETAQAIAKIAARDMWREVAPNALSFHAKRVAPNWAGKTRVATIGNHIFYR
ncbi:MAG: cell wall hydrolase [Sandarakinorhabdus sp.]|nr:cell wall hydrolase [Sandarakinorhabdus sp.]